LGAWFSSSSDTNPNNDLSNVEDPPAVVLHEPDQPVGVPEGDDDEAPAFPAMNSIQRAGANTSARSRSSEATILKSATMPPPDFIPSRATLDRPVTTTNKPPNVNRKGKPRAKVALAPGRSPLDWARLKSSGEDLRCGVTSLLRITPSELKEHNTRDDAWASFDGKVYNITPYLEYHPGGEKELMRVAGRDGSKLFALTHSWVNLDHMLDGCMVGFLVPDNQ